ncbi:MAG: hypothetical protein GC182_08740 [Rhodopseudomonas sp.]|nr:hypothetical protein [Rhodopseudomonas sp.]
MTRALPFTKASIRRAVEGARQAGLTVIGIAADGTVLTEDSAANGLATGTRRAHTTAIPADSPVWNDLQV